MSEIKSKYLSERLGHKESFSRHELAEVIRKEFPGITDTNINWKIHQLTKSGKISRSGRGLYTLSVKTNFVPYLSEKSKEIASYISGELPYLDFAIWDTTILTRFMHHLLFRNYIFVETDKDYCESLFLKIQEKFPDTFMKPDMDMHYRYFRSNEVIVVIPRISQTPLMKIDNYYSVTAEKLIVDLIADKFLCFLFKGTEIENIMGIMFSEVNINFNKLKRYALRRNAWNRVKGYIETPLPI